MTMTHSIDLNLDLTRSHGATEASLTSLPSLTPLTSPDTAVASGLVGRDVPGAPLAVAGERDARPYQALAGGDVRDMSGVSDVRPAVAGGEALPSASVAAFRRAMAEPIAENAALGEAFAAAVAATAGEAAVGVEDAKNAKTAEAEAGEEAVVASGLVGRGVLDAPTASPAVAADLPDTAVASPLSSHSSATPAIIDGDVRDVRVVSDVRPATPAVAADSPEPVAVGRISPERSSPCEARSLEVCVLDAPTAEPAIIEGDVRDVRVVSDARPASPAIAADSPESVAVGRDVLVSPERSEHREAMSLEACAPTSAVALKRDPPAPSVGRGDSDVGPASPAVAADSLDSGVVGRDVLDAPTSEVALKRDPPASSVGRGDSDARPTAEPSLTQSHEAAEPVAVGAGNAPQKRESASEGRLRSNGEAALKGPLPARPQDAAADPAAPLTSPSPLTPLTSPDTAVASAAAANIAANAAAVATTSASTPSAPAAPSSPSTVLVQAAEAVADTLLVSPGLLRGQGEIVVQLRPDVLDGTEVRIAVTGRQLDVQFCPTSVDMAVMLENGRTQIASHLSAKIASFNVTVDVRKKKA